MNRSGGGIVRGGSAGSVPVVPSDATGVVRMLRRRWTSGVAIALAATAEGAFRGITVTSFMVVSEEPPLVALAVRDDGTFATSLERDADLTVSVLEAGHEFVAERFAGRAPVPDAALTGVRHELAGDLPVISGALAWCRCRVREIHATGDHQLVVADVVQGGAGVDTDDPLLRYEGRYRRLEAG